MTKIVINGKKYEATEEEKVLQVLLREGIDIPYLCYHGALPPFGSCRLCMVEVVAGNKKGVTSSCTLPVTESLAIKTDTAEVVRIRKVLLEMYLAEAPDSERIRKLAKKYGVESSRFTRADTKAKGNRCILCGLCVRVCGELLGVGAIHYTGRGTQTCISTPWFEASNFCIGCGACAYVCPADAIDIVAEGDVRIMETWNKTVLNLSKCAESQKNWATEKGLDFLYGKCPDFPEELKDVSPDSRRKKIAADFFLKPRSK